MRFRPVILALCIAAPVSAQSDASAAAAVDRAVEAWSHVKTVRASFVQEITNSLTGGTSTARGEFVQQRPDLLSIRFTGDNGDRIVDDGTSIWIYLPSSNPGQVVKRPAVQANAVPIDPTHQFLTSPRERYVISDGGTDKVDGAAARVVILVPKSGVDAPFTRARVWIRNSDATIRKFELVQPNGITRRVHLTSLELNGPVDRSLFRFDPPEGVRVVEGR